MRRAVLFAYGARIRRLLPKIEAAMAAAASHEQILKTLQETGIDVSMNSFRSALYRARKKALKGGRKEENSGGGSSGGEGASGPPAAKSSMAASPDGRERTRDPLAVPEKPKSFDWDPTERPNITFINQDDDESAS